MKILKTLSVLFMSSALTIVTAHAHQESNVPGFTAKDSLEGFTAKDSREFAGNFTLNDALTPGPAGFWFGTNASQVFRTAIVPRRQPVKVLQSSKMPQVGEIATTTELGKLSLDEFLNHRLSGTRGFIVVHKGRIVYEEYPGMRDTDSHVTASAAKVFASLLVDVLIEEGTIAEQKTLGEYIPEFRGTSWADIKVIDTIDMSTGLDPVDGPKHFANPKTVTARLLRSELGEASNGVVETTLDVLKDAKPTSKPGTYFTYSSTATQAIVLLVEAATGQSWANAFDKYIWSKMGVEGPLQVHLSPEGIALGHGFLSLRLRDLARFGMLYTPSWNTIASEQIVTPTILERTRVPYRSREFYRNGPSGKKFMERLGDFDVRTGGRQWDAIWEDGDFFKSGFNTQGIYVSPARDLVIAYYSVESTQQIQKYLRPLVNSGLFK
jgi:CubicO group peptidase (beta-lactamase class C family)